MSAAKREYMRLHTIKYGGIEASDVKKMKDHEDKNRRLKQMFADLSLENRAFKDVIEKSVKTSDKA